ncbi:MAG: hypothetical protein GC138_03605 [Gammaproteobacteria bacterium]|nr:hypothetical protein [Gammaproteobacteria bacterium]
MATILCVKFKTDLEPEEMERRLSERRAHLYKVPGLAQKIYGRDESNGQMCAIYFFNNREGLDDFCETRLAKTFPIVYEAKDVHREIYEALYPLYPDRGPITE